MDLVRRLEAALETDQRLTRSRNRLCGAAVDWVPQASSEVHHAGVKTLDQLEVAAVANSVVHFEIPADDVERAGDFYRQAFGWDVSAMPEMGYTILNTTPTNEQGMPSTPGAINGGMMKRGEPLTGPILTIAVDDIDAALKQVESLGGSTVLSRQQVGEMGYTAYFKDTEGNTLGVWQNA